MRRKDIQQYKMLTRVAEFGAKHVSVFPTTTIVGEILAAIVLAVAKLSEHLTAQVAATAAIRRGSIMRREARQALTTQLELMDQTARALKINDFWMPKRTEQALINSGHHFADAAEALKTPFIQHGMAPDFIERLRNTVQALEGAILGRAQGKALTTRAIQEYERMLQDALNLLGRFEVLVANSMAGNTGVITEWEAARRVELVTPKPKAKPKPKPEPEAKPEPKPKLEPEAKPELEAKKTDAPPAAITTAGGEAASATAT